MLSRAKAETTSSRTGRDDRSPRADPPRAPSSQHLPGEAEQVRKHGLAVREAIEQRSILRGLVFLALLALVVTFVHYGVSRTFYSGWWRQW